MLAICAYWQMMPILSASMGAGLDLRKLLVYPVPHRKLFLVEVLLRFTSGAEMLLVLAGVMAGLAANAETGGWTRIPRLLAVALIFILFNVLLASGTRSMLERLLARRKVREVMAILMAMVWVLPRFLIATGFRPKSAGPAGAFIGTAGLAVERRGACGFAVAIRTGGMARAARDSAVGPCWLYGSAAGSSKGASAMMRSPPRPPSSGPARMGARGRNGSTACPASYGATRWPP